MSHRSRRTHVVMMCARVSCTDKSGIAQHWHDLVAFFDIYPEDDNLPGGGSIKFSGTWSLYAYFKSGYIYVNTIERGGFVVKLNKFDKCKPKTCNADNCLRSLRATSVPGRLEESQRFCGEFTKTFVADVAVLPKYVSDSCTGNVISRASSACSCLPTASSSAWVVPQ